MGCIPPKLDAFGFPTQCPPGYFLDPATNLCCPTTTAPVDFGDPTIRKIVTGLADAEVDPRQAGMLSARGWLDSNFVERVIVSWMMSTIKMFRPLIEIWISLMDDGLAILSEAFLAAQGQHAPGFYVLAAELMTDTLGIEINPLELLDAFRSGGRQAAMSDLGGKLFSTLASEFANIPQSSAGAGFNFAPGAGIGGLPDVQLSPERGIAGAKAFLGYLASFGIREGNSDFLAHYLPFGIGHFFKDFAEDFTKSLGIGRMSRQVYKPLVQTMVSKPLQDALNMQYRPNGPTVKQAYAMWNMGELDVTSLQNILKHHGHPDAMWPALQYESMERPTRNALRSYRTQALPGDPTYDTWLARLGYTPEVADLLDKADDRAPARDAALHAAKHVASQYLLGKYTRQQLIDLITGLQHDFNGNKLLTDGEVTNLKSLPTVASTVHLKHLTITQISREYLDGLITLQEFEARASGLGFDAEDVTLLTQELLLSEKRAASRAARSAATAVRGPLAKLTVAQLELAYLSQLLTLADIQTELQARQYAPESIHTLLNEFRIKAKLPPSATPAIP